MSKDWKMKGRTVSQNQNRKCQGEAIKKKNSDLENGKKFLSSSPHLTLKIPQILDCVKFPEHTMPFHGSASLPDKSSPHLSSWFHCHFLSEVTCSFLR